MNTQTNIQSNSSQSNSSQSNSLQSNPLHNNNIVQHYVSSIPIYVQSNRLQRSTISNKINNRFK